MNINKALIAGRLTKDPTLRSTPNGNTVATFSVATSQTWKDKQGQKQEKATFHNIVFWGRIAEVCGQYLTKGQEVFIEGRIETRKYQDKQGYDRYVTEIIGENMQMGAKPKGYSQSSPTSPNPGTPVKEEEIPTIQQDEDEVRIEDVPF